MVCLKFFVAAFLLVSSQCLVQSRTIHKDDLDTEFNEAITELRSQIQSAVFKAVDLLEPMLQDILLAAKEDIVRGIQELDAFERNTIKQIMRMVDEAEGNVEHCYVDQVVLINDLTELTRGLTYDCVGSTMKTAESVYDDGIAKLLGLYKLISQQVVEYESCDTDSCRTQAIEDTKAKAVQVPLDTADIIEDTRAKMDYVIPGYEDRCIGNNRSLLAIEVEEIIAKIKECIA